MGNEASGRQEHGRSVCCLGEQLSIPAAGEPDGPLHPLHVISNTGERSGADELALFPGTAARHAHVFGLPI